MLKNLFFIFITFVTCGPVFAQRSLKFENGGGPAGNGPTTTDKTVTMYYGDAGVYSPSTTVTFSLSNQQYTSIEGNPNIPGIVFGGNLNNNGNTVTSINHYLVLSNLGGSSNAQYSTNNVQPGINVSDDYGLEMATYSDALINADGSNKVPTNQTVYYGDLTLTFNRPVNNPVIHFTGLGGFNGNQGFAAGFDLNNTTYSLTKLAGSQYFAVNGNSIRNSASAIGTSSAGSGGGAAGSVQVNGTRISSITFRVYFRGDGGGNQWSNRSSVGADGFLVSVSLAAYSISGSIFNDANGLKDNTVNGTGTNAGGLNAVLIDPSTNTVVATVPVNTDGTYRFNNNVLAGNYALEITTNTATVGAAPPAVKLPDGWVSTGENIGSGAGNDGTPNGILTGLTVNGNVSDVNFAIERIPVSNDVSETIAMPANHTIAQGTIHTAVSGSDAEDGQMGNGKTVVIDSLPENGKLYYNGNEVTAGQEILNFDPSLLSFTDLRDGSTETSFKYSFVDAAGQKGNSPATFTVKWDGSLPVMWGAISARYSNGQLTVIWNTETEMNNDHFDVEASTDGVHFTNVGVVATKAPGGSSDVELNYSYSKTMNGASLAFISLLFVGVGFVYSKGRGSKVLMMGLAVIGVVILGVSCNKKDIPARGNGGELFVRIVQVDKDGTKITSKIVRAAVE